MNAEVSDTIDEPRSTAAQMGFFSAILTVAVTVVTFGLALTAIPIAGANCPGDCIQYPYLDTVSQYPKDYLWMFPATALVLLYVVLVASIHATAADRKKIFSQIGLSFAIVAAVILASLYFVQFSVVPVSLMNGETDGISLLTQYNPHGVFIALEELGYLVMSLSFLFLAPVFANRSRLESAIRWVFLIGFALAIVSTIGIPSIYGLERLDRLEVALISIDWLVLISNGVLLGVVFGRQRRSGTAVGA